MKFEEHQGEMEYKNPYKSSNATEPKFKRINPKIFNYKNGMIIKVHENYYDYLIDGELVTQRLGASKKLLEKLINNKAKAGDYHKFFQIMLEMENEK